MNLKSYSIGRFECYNILEVYFYESDTRPTYTNEPVRFAIFRVTRSDSAGPNWTDRTGLNRTKPNQTVQNRTSEENQVYIKFIVLSNRSVDPVGVNLHSNADVGDCRVSDFLFVHEPLNGHDIECAFLVIFAATSKAFNWETVAQRML